MEIWENVELYNTSQIRLIIDIRKSPKSMNHDRVHRRKRDHNPSTCLWIHTQPRTSGPQDPSRAMDHYMGCTGACGKDTWPPKLRHRSDHRALYMLWWGSSICTTRPQPKWRTKKTFMVREVDAREEWPGPSSHWTKHHDQLDGLWSLWWFVKGVWSVASDFLCRGLFGLFLIRWTPNYVVQPINYVVLVSLSLVT